MKFLTIAGTAAMFLVGGGILVHGIPPVHHEIEHLASLAGAGVPTALVAALLNGLFGVIAGAAAVGVVKGVEALRR